MGVLGAAGCCCRPSEQPLHTVRSGQTLVAKGSWEVSANCATQEGWGLAWGRRDDYRSKGRVASHYLECNVYYCKRRGGATVTGAGQA